MPETGFLIYTDLLYKPHGSWYSVSLRFQAYETDGYDTRLYAYENDPYSAAAHLLSTIKA
jgi:hypothetical protein